VPFGQNDHNQMILFPEISNTQAVSRQKVAPHRKLKPALVFKLLGTLLQAKAKNSPISHIPSAKQKQKEIKINFNT
jgi:hypothetical protein